VKNFEFGSERFAFSSDPTGGDGLVVDLRDGHSWFIENVMVPNLAGEADPIDARILAAIAHKQARGAEYAHGKSWLYFQMPDNERLGIPIGWPGKLQEGELAFLVVGRSLATEANPKRLIFNGPSPPSPFHRFSTDLRAEFCRCSLFRAERTKRNGNQVLEVQGFRWWARQGLNL
jgi:hypothetical protein